MDAEWLIDKSAYARLASAVNPEIWADRIERGLVHIATITDLEIGYSARNGPDLRHERDHPPLSEFIPESMTPQAETRALAVQQQLADASQHRAISIPDMLIAATAELAGLTVLHHDHDFELIAQFTHQPVEWLEVVQGVR